jgi:hypothetical protein
VTETEATNVVYGQRKREKKTQDVGVVGAFENNVAVANVETTTMTAWFKYRRVTAFRVKGDDDKIDSSADVHRRWDFGSTSSVEWMLDKVVSFIYSLITFHPLSNII